MEDIQYYIIKNPDTGQCCYYHQLDDDTNTHWDSIADE